MCLRVSVGLTWILHILHLHSNYLQFFFCFFYTFGLWTVTLINLGSFCKPLIFLLALIEINNASGQRSTVAAPLI